MKDETWKPVEKTVAEEPTPTEPKRMIAVTLPNGTTKLYEDTPEFRVQRAKEEKERQGQTEKPSVVYVPPAKPVAEKLIMQENPSANTYSDSRAQFTQRWNGSTAEGKE